MNKTLPTVRVLWHDAILYGPKNRVVRLTPMETIGFLEREDEHFVIIRDPKTTQCTHGTAHPEKQPTFYFIPHGMIKKIEKV